MKRVLAIQACPRGLRAAVFQRAGGSLRLQAQAEVEGPNLAQAFDGVLQALRTRTSLPRDAICLSHKAVPLCLELPRAVLPPARWQQLLRWEIEPYLARLVAPEHRELTGDWLQQSPRLDGDAELCFGWTDVPAGEGTGPRLVCAIARADLHRWQQSFGQRGLRLRAVYPHLAGAAAANGCQSGALLETHGEELALTTLEAGQINSYELGRVDQAARLAGTLRGRGLQRATLYGDGAARLADSGLATQAGPALEVPASLLGAARDALGDAQVPLASISARPAARRWSRARLLAGLVILVLAGGYLTVRTGLRLRLSQAREAWSQAAVATQRAQAAAQRGREQGQRAAQLAEECAALRTELAGRAAEHALRRDWFQAQPAFLCILLQHLSEGSSAGLSLSSIECGPEWVQVSGSASAEQEIYRFCLQLETRLAGQLHVQAPTLAAGARPITFQLLMRRGVQP